MAVSLFLTRPFSYPEDSMADQPDLNNINQKVSEECEIMKKMIAQLPTKISDPLNSQLIKVMLAFNDHNKALYKNLSQHLDDFRLSVVAMKFDLDSTRKERDKLRDQLDD
jgi:hypothetical protein